MNKIQTVDDMVEAIGLPREKLCLYCWTGECPKKSCPGKMMDPGGDRKIGEPIAQRRI